MVLTPIGCTQYYLKHFLPHLQSPFSSWDNLRSLRSVALQTKYRNPYLFGRPGEPSIWLENWKLISPQGRTIYVRVNCNGKWIFCLKLSKFQSYLIGWIHHQMWSETSFPGIHNKCQVSDWGQWFVDKPVMDTNTPGEPINRVRLDLHIPFLCEILLLKYDYKWMIQSLLVFLWQRGSSPRRQVVSLI